MKKRHVKKIVKNAKKNMTPYREAMRGGSKKLDRRREAIFRYGSPDAAARWDRNRRLDRRIKTIPQNWKDLAAVIVEFSALAEELREPVVTAQQTVG